MKDKNTLKNMWICAGQNMIPEYQTISHLRSKSIKKAEAIFGWDWKRIKSYGWKCIKVNIHFEPTP
jgi:formylmethanofuran dehydrogenase subunit A